MEHTNKLLVILGPTATGKTSLALSLAKKFNGEVVSADSRQIYKGMDIGTGKRKENDQCQMTNDQLSVSFKNKKYTLPKYEQEEGIGIWMYDVVTPIEEFSVSHYYAFATQVISDIHTRGKLPILVGGTGLYIKSILEGIETASIPRNDRLRKELDTKSVEELQKILELKDSSVWSIMNNSDRNNPRRLIRKIEILSTLPPYSPNPPNIPHLPYGDTKIIGLTGSRDLLSQKIVSRVIERVSMGAIAEVEKLLKTGYSFTFPAMNTLGYKEWQSYFEKPTEVEKQNAIHQWILDEQQYAKKQMTWFKKQPGITWLDIDDLDYQDKVNTMVALWYTNLKYN